ncbi:MAG: hypothetical protein L3K26_12000 [Candidatus Hydrogenedentes bacterium]|nr:hypothetical protein [Candidatus Hydrogenedentota bacterium]
MNRKANSMSGIHRFKGSEHWDGVDIIWCDSEAVDGYLHANYYGEVLPAGWYYEPLVLVGQREYTPRERCEGPRGPYATSNQAFRAAVFETLYYGYI